jgi:hypothetical protein
MNKLFIILLFCVSSYLNAQALNNQKIHPIVTSLGGVLLKVNPQATKVWNASNPNLDVVHAAAIHIAAQQCPDGGFGWPHNDCTNTFHNLTSPILNGINNAWQLTQNSAYLGIMVNGGNFDLLSTYPNGEFRFSTNSPLFMYNLSQASADNQYQNFVDTYFFGELLAGTYGPDDLDTSGWIASVVSFRQGTWINLLPWEFMTLPSMSTQYQHPAQAELFVQAILDNLNTMNDTSPDTVYSDIIGLAGGVYGLSTVNRQSFPAINAPLHSINGIDSLQQLTDFLLSTQNVDGSWYWHSNLATPANDDKDTQTTAYAILALIKANQRLATDYSTAIILGQTWLESMQTQYGGFASFPGGTENTEVEAEALTALTTEIVAYTNFVFSDGFE